MLPGFDAKPLKRAARRQAQRAESVIPTGVPIPFCGSVAPAGFLLCNGQAVSRQVYAALFAVIGTTFGVGDGSTTFNVPNTQDRFFVGAGNLYSLGATGGSKDAIVVTHTHGTTEFAHTHGVTQTPHAHTATGDGGGGASSGLQGTSGGGAFGGVTTSNNNANVSINSAFTGLTINSAGASGTNANLPPYLGVNFIIKT